MLKRRRARGTSGAARVAALRLETLTRYLDDAQTFKGVEAADVPDMHVQTAADERIYLCVQGAMLIEPAAEPAQPSSAHSPRTIDQGEFVVTSTRAVFTGTKQVRQWLWSHLDGIEHADAARGRSSPSPTGRRRSAFATTKSIRTRSDSSSSSPSRPLRAPATSSSTRSRTSSAATRAQLLASEGASTHL